ncbi:MAG TPA: hypothetical protein VHM00_04455 [Caldimonas sp.]|jgi:hypothetical protein|nr:hypothetical protein [Caldimonas sp.]HEX2540316.1 hypothetical protein [Caldimonas sp.]
MKRYANVLPAGIGLLTASLPSLAHMGSTPAPHFHAGDGWGLLAVAALTAIAAWLGRRGR